MRLLEVVANDLVRLDRVAGTVIEPLGEARVKLRSDRLGQCVGGSVTNREVKETLDLVLRETR